MIGMQTIDERMQQNEEATVVMESMLDSSPEMQISNEKKF
jgi:hypothetical protein